MEEALKVIDDSVKRLLVPTTMMIAAVVLTGNIGKPGAVDSLIYLLISILTLWAALYGVFSIIVTLKVFWEGSANWFLKGLASVSYFLVYASMFMFAINIGISKLPVNS